MSRGAFRGKWYSRFVLQRGAALLVALCASLGAAATEQRPRRNVLLVVADDLGVDVLRSYGEGSDFPATPTIDRLAAQGVLFRNVWADPKCSPTRATILTGRYGFRTGVTWISSGGGFEVLSPHERTLPKIFAGADPPVASALFGKWHLGNCTNGGRRGPNVAGFDVFAGSFANLVNRDQSFFSWHKTVDGVERRVERYATSDTVDDAIAWIAGQSRPWFVQLSFNAPHKPWQVPPHSLLSPQRIATLPKSADGTALAAGSACAAADARLCYDAMVEAMDAELGRLLGAIPAATLRNTAILFVADNGTPRGLSRPPFDAANAKGSLHEGGVNVPLIVSGSGVIDPGRQSDALINTTDLFATILELATGADSAVLTAGVVHDSRSLLPILDNRGGGYEHRSLVYAGLDGGGDHAARRLGHAVRNRRFKLIRATGLGTRQLYDLDRDPFEADDLLRRAQLDPVTQRNLEQLEAELDSLLASNLECPREVPCGTCGGTRVPGACRSADTGRPWCRTTDGETLSCGGTATVRIIECPCRDSPLGFGRRLSCRGSAGEGSESARDLVH